MVKTQGSIFKSVILFYLKNCHTFTSNKIMTSYLHGFTPAQSVVCRPPASASLGASQKPYLFNQNLHLDKTQVSHILRLRALFCNCLYAQISLSMKECTTIIIIMAKLTKMQLTFNNLLNVTVLLFQIVSKVFYIVLVIIL